MLAELSRPRGAPKAMTICPWRSASESPSGRVGSAVRSTLITARPGSGRGAVRRREAAALWGAVWADAGGVRTRRARIATPVLFIAGPGARLMRAPFGSGAQYSARLPWRRRRRWSSVGRPHGCTGPGRPALLSPRPRPRLAVAAPAPQYRTRLRRHGEAAEQKRSRGRREGDAPLGCRACGGRDGELRPVAVARGRPRPERARLPRRGAALDPHRRGPRGQPAPLPAPAPAAPRGLRGPLPAHRERARHPARRRPHELHVVLRGLARTGGGAGGSGGAARLAAVGALPRGRVLRPGGGPRGAAARALPAPRAVGLVAALPARRRRGPRGRLRPEGDPRSHLGSPAARAAALRRRSRAAKCYKKICPCP